MITLRPMQFADLALKTEKDPGVKMRADGSVLANWFCLATAARVAQLVYLLDIYRAQIGFPEQIRVLKREHDHWHSWKIGIEDYAYQWALGQEAWEKGLPVVPVKYPGDKVMKAQMVTPHFETGRVRIRGVVDNGVLVIHPALKQFLIEAVDFPYGENDDVVDAVCGVVQMCMDAEIIGQELHTASAVGFAAVTTGGRRGGGDPFDIWKSPY